MRHMVITVVGDDRAGLVDALSGAVAQVGGNWERSHLTELAGQFAGIVLVSAPDDAVDRLTDGLDAIEARGLLHISVAPADGDGRPEAPADPGMVRWRLELTGADHSGIVHRVSHALAGRGVNIDELETEVTPAPMEGMVFRAVATLEAPADLDVDDIRAVLEDLTPDLMVDLDLDLDLTAP